MKRGIVGGSAGVLVAGALVATGAVAGLIASAPPASAGCLYGGAFISKCDGPVQPDGTWQRCVGTTRYVPSGLSSHLVPVKHCDVMGPGRQSPNLAFADPPVHIN